MTKQMMCDLVLQSIRSKGIQIHGQKIHVCRINDQGGSAARKIECRTFLAT
jgi:hypothetical protein